MSTKKKSDAMKFIDSVIGELTFGGLIEAMRQAEEMSQVDFAKIPRHSQKGFVVLAFQGIVNQDGLKLKVSVEAA